MTTTMLTLWRLTPQELGVKYRALYDEVFAEPYDPAHVPGLVYVGATGDEVVGMLALYQTDLATAYIQYAGFTRAWQGRPMNLVWLNAVVNELHLTYRHLLAEIRADHPVALRFALKAGFAITGTRLDSSGHLLVHLLHEGRDGRIT